MPRKSSVAIRSIYQSTMCDGYWFLVREFQNARYPILLFLSISLPQLFMENCLLPFVHSFSVYNLIPTSQRRTTESMNLWHEDTHTQTLPYTHTEDLVVLCPHRKQPPTPVYICTIAVQTAAVYMRWFNKVTVTVHMATWIAWVSFLNTVSPRYSQAKTYRMITWNNDDFC